MSFKEIFVLSYVNMGYRSQLSDHENHPSKQLNQCLTKSFFFVFLVFLFFFIFKHVKLKYQANMSHGKECFLTRANKLKFVHGLHQ